MHILCTNLMLAYERRIIAKIERIPASERQRRRRSSRAVTFLSSWKLAKLVRGRAELSEKFDIYFPRETKSRFRCLSSCLPSSFSRHANSLCECLKCRRNTRNLELSDSCQLRLSENLRNMTGAKQPRIHRGSYSFASIFLRDLYLFSDCTIEKMKNQILLTKSRSLFRSIQYFLSR